MAGAFMQDGPQLAADQHVEAVEVPSEEVEGVEHVAPRRPAAGPLQLARREGILAFQIHAGSPMWVEFKNVRIKDIE